MIGNNTKIIDLKDHFAMPGMGDLHQHWDMGSLQEKQGWLDVDGAPPVPDELKKIILDYAKKNPDLEWIIGRNGSWFDDMFTKAGIKAGYKWLDRYIPERAVAPHDVQGHIIMANSKGNGVGWCAVGMGRKATTGSIEQGKSADFVILDKNLFDIGPAEISTANILQTVFEGELVFNKEGSR